MRGYTDTPVNFVQDDILDVGVYIESLSSFILDCSTPMTIAVQGDWGSGKTSIMNMIRQQVESQVVPVWFNTWQYAQFDMAAFLPVSLLNNFLSKIDAEEETRNVLRSIARGALSFTKKAAVIATDQISGALAENVKELGDRIFSDPLSDDQARILEELIEKIHKAVDKKLASVGKERIVVFVDDLDRLAPEKAVEVLEVLKIFMDVPNCVYILAVDYSVITQGLAKKFGADIGHRKGKSFFDKIIQLPFTVPTAQYNISAYVKNMLSNIGIDCNEENVSIYRDLVDISLGCNPRGMKRLFNTYILLDKVATRKGIYDGDDSIVITDKQRILFAVLCLQMAFHELYEFLVKNIHEIDADFFEGLKDPDLLKTDAMFLSLHKALPTDIEQNEWLYEKISDFMEVFLGSLRLKMGVKSSLNQDEFATLKSILSFSVITSTTADDVQSVAQQGRRFSLEKGSFTSSELEEKLRETMSRQSNLTPRFATFIEVLLSEDRAFHRDEIKKMLRKNGVGKNIGQTGRYLSNISQFLTKQSNSHLRQVIEFDSGSQTAGQRKDNYKITTEYRSLIENIISEYRRETLKT